MWTERLGFVAGLASINKMEQYSVQEKLIEYGIKIKNGWLRAAKDADIKISISGLDSIPYFSFDYDNKVELLTYFNQEMLEAGFLATGGTASTFAYTDEILNRYQDAVSKVFKGISQLDFDVKSCLKGPVKHMTFSRLTG